VGLAPRWLIPGFVFLFAFFLSCPAAANAQQQAQALFTRPLTTNQVQGYTLPPAQEAQAISYARARTNFTSFDVAYSLFLLILLLQTSRPCKISRDSRAEPGNKSLVQDQSFLFRPLLLTIDVLSLPTAIWSHRLALKYQQSIEGWGSCCWTGSRARPWKWLIGGKVSGSYAVIRRSPGGGGYFSGSRRCR